MATECTEVKDVWSDDLLGRRADAQFLKRFLVQRIKENFEGNRKRSYVLNVDAGWGQGKSFFLGRFKQELEKDGHLAVYVNAWEDDHADDPLIAVMSAVDEALRPRLKKKKALQKVWETTKRSGLEITTVAAAKGLKKLTQKLIGEGVEEIADLIQQGEAPTALGPDHQNAQSKDSKAVQVSEALSEGVDKFLDRQAEDALKSFKKARASIASFKNNLSKFLVDAAANSSLELPLFVLVDELDRCRPTYSIHLLERIKHLFDVDNVVFVVATDSSQLRHSIKAVYGESFESGRYLLRFFDRT